VLIIPVILFLPEEVVRISGNGFEPRNLGIVMCGGEWMAIFRDEKAKSPLRDFCYALDPEVAICACGPLE
jgi:hypothetical protein